MAQKALLPILCYVFSLALFVMPLQRISSEVDPSLPNLLHEDPFYTSTLPKMLGPDFKPKGILYITNLGKPDNLHPFTNYVITAKWITQCVVTVAQLEFGKFETFAPNMAYKVEERKRKKSEGTEYWVHLRDGVYWEPLNPAHFSQGINPFFTQKHQVTAYDYKFYYDAINNPHVQEPGALASRDILGNIEELEVIDKLTFIVRFKTKKIIEPDGKIVSKIKYTDKFSMGTLRPLASFVYQYFPDGKKIIEDDNKSDIYRTDAIWAQNFTKHWAMNVIVSCGPWLFDGMTDQQIKFKRNPNYYFPYAVLSEGMEVSFKNTPDAMWLDFVAGKIDIYTLLATQLFNFQDLMKSGQYIKQKTEDPSLSIKTLEYVPYTYYYVGWNETTPFFKSKKVRQAMTMAIDRKRIIDQMLNGKAVETTGPTYPFSYGYDTSITPWPYDPQTARRLLEEDGWFDRDGSGMISKIIDGKKVPFSFKMTYLFSSTVAKPICEYIVTALKEVGIECKLNALQVSDFFTASKNKTDEASFRAWVYYINPTTFPEQLRPIWYSTGAKAKGSGNIIGFANKEADEIIDKLDYEYDRNKRVELYRRFHAIMHEEQPYTFLFIPLTILEYRNYVQNLFIPAKRQDLIPGANIQDPEYSIVWINK